MPDYDDDAKLYLHWDGTDKAIHEYHCIDATTLVEAVGGFQKFLCLLAMDMEGQDPRQRAKISEQYMERFKLNFQALTPGSVQLEAVVGSRDDVVNGGVLPELIERSQNVLGIFSDNQISDPAAAFSRIVKNPAIRSRIVKNFRNMLPRVGSGRTFSVGWGKRRHITFSEESHKRLSLLETKENNELSFIQSVVNGTLLEMDFANRAFQIYYPPTKKTIKCVYEDEDEPVLVENRRDWVQVRGIVVLDADGHPTEINNVDSVIAVDMTEIEFRTIILSDGSILGLNHPIIFSPKISEDGQILEVVDETTGINAYGQARDDLIEAIRDDIDAIWLNYAHPSLPLAAEAAALGEWWRNNAKILSEGQQ